MVGGIKDLNRPKSTGFLRLGIYSLVLALLSLLALPNLASALILTESGNTNVTALVLPIPPNEQAVIDQPKNNSHLDSTPLVVKGTCGSGLTVRIYNKDSLIGTTTCSPLGSFVVNVTLVVGKNVLRVMNFDSFDQAGPNSPVVTVYVDIVVTENGHNTASNGPGVATQPDDRRPIFSNTPLSPVANILGLTTRVSPAVQTYIATSINIVFSLVILAIIFLVFI